MVALQIRDVSEDVREALAESARKRGQSLQAFLLALVEGEAQRSGNLALLERFDGRQDGSVVAPAAAADAVDRARRDLAEEVRGAADSRGSEAAG